MMFDLLTPPVGQKKCAVERPIHVSNWQSKFGWISSNGLGGDSITYRHTEAITISPSLLKTWGYKFGV